MKSITLPPDWIIKTIADVTEPIEKVNPRESPESEFIYIDIASIDNSIQKITTPKKYKGSNAPSRARQSIKAGDVLFSTVRTYLKNIASVTKIYDGQIASTGFSVLRANTEITGKFLFYYSLTDTFLNPLNELQRGTSYPAVRDNDVREQLIPVPPLPEQERIVERIESLFTQLDAGVAGLKRARAALKRYKASVLKAACEGRLVPQDPNDEPAEDLLNRILTEKGEKEYRILANNDNLKELPDRWVWARVEQLAFVGTGATPLRSKLGYYKNGKFPWVTSGALNNLFVDRAEEYISDLALGETNAKVFPSGTLLVAMYGEGKTRGKVSELRIDAATNQACAALVFTGVSTQCKPYVKMFFQNNYEDIRRLSSGGVQPNLNLGLIKRTEIPLPPLAEQRRIIAEIERRLSVVHELEQTVESNLKRVGRLRQAILMRAFEGRLVEQDPQDVPV